MLAVVAAMIDAWQRVLRQGKEGAGKVQSFGRQEVPPTRHGCSDNSKDSVEKHGYIPTA